MSTLAIGSNLAGQDIIGDLPVLWYSITDFPALKYLRLTGINPLIYNSQDATDNAVMSVVPALSGIYCDMRP